MAKQDLAKLLSQSAARSTPVEIRRGKGVGLSIEEESSNPQEPHVLWITIDHLLDNPYQHAEEINQEDYEALVESIKLDGFQGALNVSPAESQDGYYFITGGGHQRRNAARDAGLEKLPVFVGASPAEKKQLGLRLARENTAQVNRSPVNLGFLYIQLIEEFGMTQAEIATEIKKDRYHVNFAIMAARSASDIRAALREKYSPRVMTYLRRLEMQEDRAPIITQYLAGELTVDGVRTAVEKVQAEEPQPNASLAQQQAVYEEASTPAQKEVAPSAQAQTREQPDAQAILQEVKALTRTDETEQRTGELLNSKETEGDQQTSEQTAKAQAAFSRVETYRRYLERKRADGVTVVLSDQEATLLGKVIDRCHTLLDTYGKKVV
jgi:ParB family chromosome partitioning protein